MIKIVKGEIEFGREMLGLSRTVVVLPSEVAAATENLLAAHRALDGSDMPCDIIPLSPGGAPSPYAVKGH